MESTVSVIIPTFNRARYIRKAIDSVLSQSYKDHEIIVVDDGSTDNTPDVLEAYTEKVTVIRQENAGVSAARNAGIRLAQGEWIAFLDSDDEWMPEYLAWQMERAQEYPEACMHITNSVQVKEGGVRVNTFQDNMYGLANRFLQHACLIMERPLSFILRYHITNLQATIVKRSSLARAGLFNESLTIAEDLDLIARISLQGPLGICSYPYAHIIRREEGTLNLTDQLYAESIGSLDAFYTVYDGLRKRPEVTSEEKSVIADMMSSNRRAAGNLHIHEGGISKARSSYLEAFRLKPSLKSAGKLTLSFLPIGLSRYFAKKPGYLTAK